MITLNTIETQRTFWLVPDNLYEDDDRLDQVFKTPGTVLLAYVEEEIFPVGVSTAYMEEHYSRVGFDPIKGLFIS